ncbi:MAG: threonine/serine exporter family protein [Bacillota bacterium]|nr:threonine/serine exporter family protein [Bacillota bacterium]
MEYDQLLESALQIGEGILCNGGEVYRVEESIKRIIKAYGIDSVEVFAIPSFIITTINTTDGQVHTKSKRIYSIDVNLEKVDLYNQLCRKIALEKMDYNEMQKQITTIENKKVYNLFLQILAGTLIGLSFTLLFGGDIRDALCSALSSALIKYSYISINRFHMNIFFTNIVSSTVSTAAAIILTGLGLGNSIDIILIGSLMNLVPGVAITNFMRDIMAGDLMSGLAKFTESFLIATAIALGTGFALSIFYLI